MSRTYSVSFTGVVVTAQQDRVQHLPLGPGHLHGLGVSIQPRFEHEQLRAVARA